MKATGAITALCALAQESRLAVFRRLVRAGPSGLPAGQISARARIPKTTLSFHLAQLSHAGLLRARRDGRSIIYAVNFETIRGLLGFLTENCCQDDPTACAPPARSRNPQEKGGVK